MLSRLNTAQSPSERLPIFCFKPSFLLEIKALQDFAIRISHRSVGVFTIQEISDQ